MKKEIHGEEVIVEVWDNGGQDTNVTASFYRNAQCALIICDGTATDGASPLKVWYEQLDRNAPSDVKVALLINKVDMPERTVEKYIVENMAPTMGNAPVFETSAKNGTGITEAFECVVGDIVDSINARAKVKVMTKKTEEKSGCCIIM